MANSKKVLIVVHKNCMDGLGSLYCLNQYFTKIGWIVDYLFLNYGDEQLVFDQARTTHYDKIVFGDFSLKRDKMIELLDAQTKRNVNSLDHDNLYIEIYDHHESALNELANIGDEYSGIKCVLDMDERSGAMICYDEFADYITADRRLFEYISDRDRWAWVLPNTKEINYGLAFMVKFNDLESFTSIASNNDVYNQLLVSGKVLIKKVDDSVHNKLTKCRKVHIELSEDIKYELMAINATENISELGNAMATKYNLPALLYFITEDNDVIVSLRSNSTLPPVNKIAEAFGGGGHPNAAGFKLPLNRLSELLLSDNDYPLKHINKI